jgi:predicted nuclease of predicted toxin-antitoxin system
MKVLLDTCVWGGVSDLLRDAGHEVDWVGAWPEDPGDEAILARARGGGCVPVTLDKDFGELAIVRGLAHCGIARLVGMSARRQGHACRHVLSVYEEELRHGAIVTAEPGRVRIRPPG